jgi:hypothetical protein
MRRKPRLFRPRSGIALILVIAVIAIATVMAYAMLSGGASQEQVAYNSTAQANADALAESGVSLAMYYLMHPTSAPVTPPYTKSGITFSSSTGSVTLTVSSPTQVSTSATTIGESYPVTSAATVNGITRSVTVTVLVNQTFQAPQAVSSNIALTLNSSTKLSSSGIAIVANGGINYGGANVSGTVYSTATPTGTDAGSATSYVSSTISNPSPTFTQTRSYATYTYNGQTCTAGVLASTITSAPVAASNNPAGIFISTGNVSVTGTVSITGTLIVNGSLTLSGGGTVNLTVTPVSADSSGHSFPAVLSSNQFVSAGSNKKGTFNGLCLFQNGITTSGSYISGSTLTVNGGLLLPSTYDSTSAPYKGSVTITYNSANAAVPDLTTSVTTPLSVKMTSWSD